LRRIPPRLTGARRTPISGTLYSALCLTFGDRKFADSVLNHTAKAIDLDDIEARLSELEPVVAKDGRPIGARDSREWTFAPQDCALCGARKEDDPADHATWIKANPSLKHNGGFLLCRKGFAVLHSSLQLSETASGICSAERRMLGGGAKLTDWLPFYNPTKPASRWLGDLVETSLTK
jgi:hypothetical protein